MNMPFPTRGQVEFTRSSYPPGTRIVMSSMNTVLWVTSLTVSRKTAGMDAAIRKILPTR